MNKFTLSAFILCLIACSFTYVDAAQDHLQDDKKEEKTELKSKEAIIKIVKKTQSLAYQISLFHKNLSEEINFLKNKVVYDSLSTIITNFDQRHTELAQKFTEFNIHHHSLTRALINLQKIKQLYKEFRETKKPAHSGHKRKNDRDHKHNRSKMLKKMDDEKKTSKRKRNNGDSFLSNKESRFEDALRIKQALEELNNAVNELKTIVVPLFDTASSKQITEWKYTLAQYTLEAESIHTRWVTGSEGNQASREEFTPQLEQIRQRMRNFEGFLDTFAAQVASQEDLPFSQLSLSESSSSSSSSK